MGVIVARNVGKAVVRNRVRRRIKAVGWSLAQELHGLDVVLRALPSAADADFADIDGEVRRLVGVLKERA
jgi:ribonuclease P protein component